MKDYSKAQMGFIASRIRAYCADAAAIARGAEIITRRCYLDGIHSVEALSDAIVALGEAYIRRSDAIRNARPVVRGDTISIFQPTPAGAPANTPSVEDEAFLAACRRQYLDNGFILARDADTYEEIAKKYPHAVRPARLRGSEAKRWRDMRLNDHVAKKIKKKFPR